MSKFGNYLYLLCISLYMYSCEKLNNSVDEDIDFTEAASDVKTSNTALDFPWPSTVNNPLTSNNCFMDAVLKCLCETGILDDIITTDISDDNYQLKKSIEEYRDCVKQNKVVNRDLVEKILKAFADSKYLNVIGYELGQFSDGYEFFNVIINIYECLQSSKFSIEYLSVCGCWKSYLESMQIKDDSCIRCNQDVKILLQSTPNKYIAFNTVPRQSCKNKGDFETISFKSQDGRDYDYILRSICVFNAVNHYYADVRMPDGNYMRYDTLKDKTEIIAREKIFQYCNDSIISLKAGEKKYTKPFPQFLIYEYCPRS